MEKKETIQKLAQLIDGIEIAMLTTIDQQGMLHSRPMAAQNVPFDGELWFFTHATSPKVGELGNDGRVNLSFSEPSKHRFVSVSGKADLIRDRQRAQQLWSPVLKAWFPDGLEDPELVLLRVRVEHAEYWDSPSGKMVQLVGLMKALATGKRASDSPSPGEHKKLDLTG